MNKHFLISIFIIAIVIAIPAYTHAAFISSQASFGGKVITNQLSIATCIGIGTGPMVLTSNIESFGSNNIGSAIYGAIPYYANMNFSSLPFIQSLPKNGNWILGRAAVVPNFDTCFFEGTTIPFPVKTISNYKTN